MVVRRATGAVNVLKCPGNHKNNCQIPTNTHPKNSQVFRMSLATLHDVLGLRANKVTLPEDETGAAKVCAPASGPIVGGVWA